MDGHATISNIGRRGYVLIWRRASRLRTLMTCSPRWRRRRPRRRELPARGRGSRTGRELREGAPRGAAARPVVPVRAARFQSSGGVTAELFPERYCRRLGLGRSAVASTILNRPDAAEALAELCGETVSKAEETERTAKKESVLFNGDVHDGHWLFGRKHGPGAYDFVSGAKYEGKWQSGTVGIGWYTKDGKRNLGTNRRS